MKRGGLARRQAILFYAFVSPWIIGFLAFYIGPMIASFYLSLTSYEIIQPGEWVGLGNYGLLLTGDSLFWHSMSITAVYSALRIPLGLLIALGIALLLNQQLRGMSIYRTIYFLPTLLPAVASSILWVWVFEPNYGVLNNGLALVGVQGPRWLGDVDWALYAMVIMSLWGFGGAMIIFLAGLQGVPRTLYEAAMIDGANRWARFWNVTFPMISPVFFFNLVLGTIGAMQVFGEAYVVGMAGPGPGGPANATLFYYVLYLYTTAFTYLRMGYGAAMAWVLFLLILLLTGLNFVVGRRWVYYAG
ncbi:MAG: sugar ABC transporter permease [Chloroflexi bacterium]|nr:sugar ABC transporter permease [Chloroflexota bacterium]